MTSAQPRPMIDSQNQTIKELQEKVHQLEAKNHASREEVHSLRNQLHNTTLQLELLRKHVPADVYRNLTKRLAYERPENSTG